MMGAVGAAPRRRAGGRGGNARRGAGFALEQMPWRIPLNPDRPTEPIDAEGVEAIHRGAMHILSQIGIEFLNDEALALFRQAGCLVEGQRVRMGPEFVTEMLARAPSSFAITPRNPARRVVIGGRHMVFVNVSSPPNAWDLVRGKRPGDFE